MLNLSKRGWQGRMTRYFIFGLWCASLTAQPPDTAFFESKIRPVLASKCFACHSSTLKSPMGGLVLDTKAGFKKGGALGPVIDSSNPARSRMLQALRYTDPHLQMPPGGKLPDPVLADFERWIMARARPPHSHTAPPAPGTPPLSETYPCGVRPLEAVQPPRGSASTP